MRREFVTEMSLIDAIYGWRLAAWKDERLEWETCLVLHAWDNDLGRFPPYVTDRNQLGNKQIDIPREWAETLLWRPAAYCATCLKGLVMHCPKCSELRHPAKTNERN